MNKLIYAIGIAVATSFSSSLKVDEKVSSGAETESKEQIEQLPVPAKADTLKMQL